MAEEHRLYVVDGVAEAREAGGAEALVGGGDEVLDARLVGLEVGVHARLVEDAGALGLGEDEVEEEGEADVGVEGDPGGPSVDAGGGRTG